MIIQVKCRTQGTNRDQECYPIELRAQIELYALYEYQFGVVDICNEDVDREDPMTSSALCVYISPDLDAYDDLYDLETALHDFKWDIQKFLRGENELLLSDYEEE